MAVQLKLKTQTVHLAVKLLDLVCLGCLQLAAKIHEKESNIPRGSQLISLLPEPLSLSAFLSLEFVMLSFFQWSICLPTSCYLTELLLPYCLHPSDKQHGQK